MCILQNAETERLDATKQEYFKLKVKPEPVSGVSPLPGPSTAVQSRWFGCWGWHLPLCHRWSSAECFVLYQLHSRQNTRCSVAALQWITPSIPENDRVFFLVCFQATEYLLICTQKDWENYCNIIQAHTQLLFNCYSRQGYFNVRNTRQIQNVICLSSISIILKIYVTINRSNMFSVADSTNRTRSHPQRTQQRDSQRIVVDSKFPKEIIEYYINPAQSILTHWCKIPTAH